MSSCPSPPHTHTPYTFPSCHNLSLCVMSLALPSSYLVYFPALIFFFVFLQFLFSLFWLSLLLCYIICIYIILSPFCPLLLLYFLCGLSLYLPHEPCPILLPVAPSLFHLSKTYRLPFHNLFLFILTSPFSLFFSHHLSFLQISL